MKIASIQSRFSQDREKVILLLEKKPSAWHDKTIVRHAVSGDREGYEMETGYGMNMVEGRYFDTCNTITALCDRELLGSLTAE